MRRQSVKNNQHPRTSEQEDLPGKRASVSSRLGRLAANVLLFPGLLATPSITTEDIDRPEPVEIVEAAVETVDVEETIASLRGRPILVKSDRLQHVVGGVPRDVPCLDENSPISSSLPDMEALVDRDNDRKNNLRQADNRELAKAFAQQEHEGPIGDIIVEYLGVVFKEYGFQDLELEFANIDDELSYIGEWYEDPFGAHPKDELTRHNPFDPNHYTVQEAQKEILEFVLYEASRLAELVERLGEDNLTRLGVEKISIGNKNEAAIDRFKTGDPLRAGHYSGDSIALELSTLVTNSDEGITETMIHEVSHAFHQAWKCGENIRTAQTVFTDLISHYYPEGVEVPEDLLDGENAEFINSYMGRNGAEGFAVLMTEVILKGDGYIEAGDDREGSPLHKQQEIMKGLIKIWLGYDVDSVDSGVKADDLL